jgi:integrase
MTEVDKLGGIAAPKKQKQKIGKTVANVDGVRAYETAKGMRFQAQVRVKGRAPISKSFLSRELALAWKRAEEQATPEVGAKKTPGTMTMRQLFAHYVEKYDSTGNPLSESQQFMFKRLAKHPVLENVLVSEMQFKQAEAYCRSRKMVDGVHPSTITAEFCRIALALRKVGKWEQWGKQHVPFDPLAGAMTELKEMNLIAESNKRDRRPSAKELDAILAYFRNESKDVERAISGERMADIIEFAALNAFRRGEITRLQWSAVKGQIGIACERKDPSSPTGRRATLTPVMPLAMAIILRQPRVEGEDRIFPFNPDSLGQRFADACDALQIEDLRFHDLRHEAASTLSSKLGMAEAMQVTGHKTTRSFLRYVNLEEETARIAAKMASITLKTAVTA